MLTQKEVPLCTMPAGDRQIKTAARSPQRKTPVGMAEVPTELVSLAGVAVMGGRQNKAFSSKNGWPEAAGVQGGQVLSQAQQRTERQGAHSFP